VPLYTSILYKVMKENGTHEGTIEQIVRLFAEQVGPGRTPKVDEAGRIRIDDREMRAPVQATIDQVWQRITSENLLEVSDYTSFKREFRTLFGFEVDGVDYSKPVEVEVPLV